MRPQRENQLELVPLLKDNWQRAEGVVAIRAPRFKSKLGRRLSRLIGVNPDFFVRIRDPLALAIFELIDGKRTVGEIGTIWAKRFPDEQQPVERLVDFLGIFERNRWLEYHRSTTDNNKI